MTNNRTPRAPRSERTRTRCECISRTALFTVWMVLAVVIADQAIAHHLPVAGWIFLMVWFLLLVALLRKITP